MTARKYWCELWQGTYQSGLVESFHDFVDTSWQPSVVNCLAEAIKRRDGKESKIAEYRLKVYDDADRTLILDYPGSTPALEALRSGKLTTAAPPSEHALSAFTDEQLLGELRRRLQRR